MFGIDIDPARLEAAIVIGVTRPPDPETGEIPPLIVGVAQKWQTETGVDEAAIAAALIEWADLWNPEAIGFDPYTCAGLVERLPAETYPTEPIAGVKWVNACSALWDVTVNESLRHGSDAYLDAQIASAGRRDVGDGSFRIARLNSAIAIPGVMALARTVYLSLRPRRTYEICPLDPLGSTSRSPDPEPRSPGIRGPSTRDEAPRHDSRSDRSDCGDRAHRGSVRDDLRRFYPSSGIGRRTIPVHNCIFSSSSRFRRSSNSKGFGGAGVSSRTSGVCAYSTNGGYSDTIGP